MYSFAQMMLYLNHTCTHDAVDHHRTLLESSGYMYALASFFRSTGTGSPHILDQ